MQMMILLAVAFGFLAPQSAWKIQQEDRRRVLQFETADLAGWGGGPRDTFSQDSAVVHNGRYSGRMDRGPEAGGEASIMTLSLPRSFSGERLELRGWLRTQDVSGFAGIWLREDGRNGVVEFDNMQDQNLAGTTEWKEYRLSLPLNDGARTVLLGALLVGEGTLWVDDLELWVDGTPASEAPPFVPVFLSAELDTEFDEGSGIGAGDLLAVDVENLAVLGRVWGFVKYHHPRVRAGDVNFDYELFRVLPAVLEATDRTSANLAMAGWLSDLGDPDECDPCAELPVDLHLTPNTDWIRDLHLVGPVLGERLQLIQERRPTDNEHYYVSHAPGVGNPDFSNETSYREQPLPDPGFRLLSLFRFWNIIEYWFPYRDLIGDHWETILTEFIPQILSAETEEEYRLTMMEITARVNDTHANLWANLDLRPPRGTFNLPVILRFIEGKAVVTGFSESILGPATGLGIGDIIEEIDGSPVDSLVAAWSPLYSASNQPTRLRDIARNLTKGDPGPVQIRGERANGTFTLTAKRVAIDLLDGAAGRTHDLPGDAFQMLSEEVAYLKLSSVVAADIQEYVTQASGAEVLVVDVRNYPSEFVVFALGGRLVTETREFARFTHGDGANPGAFLWTPPVSLRPLQPHFPGTIVVLIDEVSQSQAEYTTMALRAAPNAIVVGSTTAGADGNISPIPLPGGINSMISGIGVFYPDGTPTQRVGIVPDIEFSPTIEGIRAGRDEVLEAAVSHALGREFRLGG